MTNYVERLQQLEQVAELVNKGWKTPQIARELELTLYQANSLVNDYNELVKTRVESDPDFLDRLTENTLAMIDSMDMLLKEAWDAYETAKQNESVPLRTQTLKLAMDITERKAKLLQLMGGKVEGGSIARLQKAERVNEIVTSVIKEIVSDCPKCRQLAQIRLAEAFNLMGKADESASPEPLELVGEKVSGS
jgi:hypothetical protein